MRTESKVAQEQQKWNIGRGPIVFTGGPTLYQGHVELVNNSTDDVEPGAITITKLDPKLTQNRPLPGAIACARLAPHERKWVPIEVTLDPTTPPGRYTGQVSCGTRREDVVINVLENSVLNIAPQKFDIIANSHETTSLRILVTNQGNSEIRLPKTASIYLEHDLEIQRHFNRALKVAGKEGYEKFLDRFILELAGAAVDEAAVHFKPEGAKLQPSETKSVDLELQFPDDLQKGKVYRGSIRLWNARLRLEVKCVGREAVKNN